uniref:Uncharacterized protein LOC114344641 n=1 Tax=Diabrotica virgifera virgifera TaxID=50390 RepID=A0A6P7GNR7_DIAVI
MFQQKSEKLETMVLSPINAKALDSLLKEESPRDDRSHHMRFKLTPFDGKSSWSIYLRQFEAIATANHCTEQEKHMKSHDDINVNAKSKEWRKQCGLCDFRDSNKNLISHFQMTHGIEIVTKTLVFASERDFHDWKLKFEDETIAQFVKRSSRSTNKCKTVHFTCNRSGMFKPACIKRKRHIKLIGSNKINSYCPASLKLIVQEDNTCNLTLIETHVGHQMELGHVNLRKEDRTKIAQRIATKVPFSEILNEVRESVTESDVYRRHLVTRKDLHNIEKGFNLSSFAIRHPNDAISVESWINEMKQKQNCILFYKPQGAILDEEPQLKANDFVLIIMTPAQKEFLLKFGSDVICMDGTHGLNSYNFELTTLLVLDNLREGFPCSFLISNRSDKEIMVLFLTKIRNETSFIKPAIFMSDMAETYYNSWIETMEVPERRLYCSWHVLRAWRKNLMKIKLKEKQEEVFTTLRALMEERDEQVLYRMLQIFLNSTDTDIKDFIKYFKDNYSNNIRNWAYAFRLNCGINTNMHLERLHKTIKYLYMKGKKVKRLDKAIVALMTLIRDKFFDKLISGHKGKICSKIKEIRKRHKASEYLANHVIIKTENGWKIPSKNTKELYYVEKAGIICNNCQLKCTECQICIHFYKCTCLDSAIKYNMCKHIHAVAGLMYSENIADNGPQEETEANEVSERSLILREISGNKLKSKMDEEKQAELIRLKKHFEQIKTPEEWEIYKKIIAPLSPTLAATRSSVTQFPVLSNEPHNKKIKVQRALFSTKKKSKKSKKQ